jgi:propanediol dehydratase large subunit
MGRARVAGDYLQTAAIFHEQMNVLSKVTDPNDYQGPGTGYEVSPARREEMAGIRQQRSREDHLARQAAAPAPPLIELDRAIPGVHPDEVVVAVSPAFGEPIRLTMSGMPVEEALLEIAAGIAAEGCTVRIVRVRSTFDLGVIGLTAARLAGSGIGVGLQAKGTAVINRRDLPPLACLELLSIAPILTADLYRDLGANAATYARGLQPKPVRNPYTDQAIEGRYHAEVVALAAVEREAYVTDAPPVELMVAE